MSKKKTTETKERDEIIPVVRERSHGCCERCGREGQSFHHRKNRSQGGKWTVANIVHLCGDGTRGCHGWITEHPTMAGLEGYTVLRGEDPEAIPLLIIKKRWCTLTTNGEYHEVVPPVREWS